uniref:Cardiolipin synthase B n=1 Tax=Candidatus Methanogaster sp. ANME-2c ERB4 TaxID=2759911 RepID=A0A7G9YFD6_9EURY|nr:cardiolipin synthase B [Methanosarcinales archaeon ANME-2c ERB4]
MGVGVIICCIPEIGVNNEKHWVDRVGMRSMIGIHEERSRSVETPYIKAIRIILVFMILGTALCAEANPSVQDMSKNVMITEIYYDTYLKGDTDGEFIRIHNPTADTVEIGGWQLTDLEGAITFPSWTDMDAGNCLYLAYNATAFYDETLQKADFEYGVDSDSTPDMVKTSGTTKLSNAGDEVILKDEKGEIVDVVIYGTRDPVDGWTGTPVEGVCEGVILERGKDETTGKYEDTDSAEDWNDFRVYVVGQSHFSYETFGFDGNVTVFTSPDSSFTAIADAIDNASESICLNLYQFHNFYLMDRIIDAIERGVEVKILLEGGPVNGIADEERYIASKTVAAGGDVRFMISDGDRGIHDRYVFNHAKYAIIDDETTIVTTENWKNTGVPINNTFGNRGWGIIMNNPDTADYFSSVFVEDWKPASKDSFSFTSDDPIYGNKYGSPPPDFVPDRTIPTGNYTSPFGSKIVSGTFNVSPVLSPDTSLLETGSIIGMIKGANDSVYVEQLYIRNWGTPADPKPNPFLEAAINASRRGCEVKILLDSTYGVKNEEMSEYLNDIAAYENLNLEAKLIDNAPMGLNKTHTKGVIVDCSQVLISSINWNENSARNNREAGLIIENKGVAEFYTDVFLYDWWNGAFHPKASFTYAPDHPVVDQNITFDASSSTDLNGRIIEYNWNNGCENTTATSCPVITYTYAIPGSYTVTLTVTDDDDTTDTTSKIITVEGICGDLNHDGTITLADATIALLMVVGAIPDTREADVNSDDKVTSLDVLMIIQSISGYV